MHRGGQGVARFSENDCTSREQSEEVHAYIVPTIVSNLFNELLILREKIIVLKRKIILVTRRERDPSILS